MAALRLLWMGMGVWVIGAQAKLNREQERKRKTFLVHALTDGLPSVRRWSQSPGCSFDNTGRVQAWSQIAGFVLRHSSAQNAQPRGPRFAFSASLEADASWSCGASAILDFQQEGLFLTSHSGETFLFSNSTKFKIPVSPGTR